MLVIAHFLSSVVIDQNSSSLHGRRVPAIVPMDGCGSEIASSALPIPFTKRTFTVRMLNFINEQNQDK